MATAPNYVAPARFTDADAALAQVRAIYDGSVAHLRASLQAFVAGDELVERVRGCYPFVRVHTNTVARADSRLSYGFVAGPGTYETTLTRPDLFGNYYLEQFRLLLKNHQVVARDRHQRSADPGPLLARRERPSRRQPERRAPHADARPLRSA